MAFRRSDYGDPKKLSYTEVAEFSRTVEPYRFLTREDLEMANKNPREWDDVFAWEICVLFNRDELLFIHVEDAWLEYCLFTPLPNSESPIVDSN